MDNDSPFEGIPFFGDFEKLFGGGGQDHWSTAKQIAVQMAAGEDGDSNVDPSHRIALEELSRVAQLHVSDATGLESRNATVVPVTRTEWAHATIEAYQPLFEELNASLGKSSRNEIESMTDRLHAPDFECLSDGEREEVRDLSKAARVHATERAETTEF